MNNIALSIGPVNIYWYAIIIVFGIFLAYFVVGKLAKQKGISEEFYSNLIVYGVVFEIIVAIIYYVLFNLEFYLQNPAKIFMINEGGLAIHGGIIVAFVWGFYYTRKHKVDTLIMFDLGSIGFLLAQSIGRWGNFVNQEAHGGETTLEFLQKLPIPQFIIDGMYIDGVYYHPTFLYESVWNMIGFIIVITLRDKLFKTKGDIFCFFIVWYSFIRFFIEGMRTDSLYLGDFRVAQIISLIGIVGGVVFFFVKRKYIVGGKNDSSNNIT